MDNVTSGTNKQFSNLLDLVGADQVGPRPSIASAGMGLGPSVGDDLMAAGLMALGPSVGDDNGPTAPSLTMLGPCVGDDDIRGDDVFAPAR